MRVLDTFTPTQTQKRILAIIAGAATPTVAGDAILNGANMVAARDILANLGFITFINGEATLTAQGQQLATAENITDETGALTNMGEELAQATSSQSPAIPPAEEPIPPMENFAVLKAMLK